MLVMTLSLRSCCASHFAKRCSRDCWRRSLISHSSLETDTLPFPKVCEGSQLTRKLQLENRGDMPARFRWQTGTFGQHFSVAPADGVVPAGSEMTFEVAFHPRVVDDDEGTASVALHCLAAAQTPTVALCIANNFCLVTSNRPVSSLVQHRSHTLLPIVAE